MLPIMSEYAGNDIVAIERGDINEEDWNSLVLMARTWGGHVVMKEMLPPLDESERATHPLDGVYAGLEEFREFALADDGTPTPGSKAFAGIISTAFDQRAGVNNLDRYPRILFRKEPPEHESKGAALQRRSDPNLAVDLGSFDTFLSAFYDDAGNLSDEQLKQHLQKLPKNLREAGTAFCRRLLESELRITELDN